MGQGWLRRRLVSICRSLFSALMHPISATRTHRWCLELFCLTPLITPLSPQEESDWEGCLSVPGLRGVVPRFSHIRYTGFDQYGDPIDRTVAGFHARVVQHECDHLIGKLYPMRIRDFAQFGYTEVLFPGLDASKDD